MAEVTLEKVKKQYPGSDKAAVKGLDLVIDDGEFLVLVGPSGCGKSTLLRMVAGLVETTSGRIRIDGRDITGLPPKDRDISMVFQNYALFPHMNAYDNMAFGLRIRGTGGAEIERTVTSAAELLGIKDLLKKKPKELSGGQRQRVALGRAIVRNPKVFLFDEPLSNLDAKLRTQMRAEISRLHRKLGTTTIYVTHDQCEALTMADRVAVLNDGELQQCGKPLEIYANPRNTFVASFIGTPPMNLFDAELVLQGGGPFFKVLDMLLPVAEQTAVLLQSRGDRNFTVGIRPEHVYPESMRPPGAKAGSPISCEVELAESMGSEVCLHCNASGLMFQSAQKHGFPVKAGDRLRMVFAVDKLHVFDRDGNSLKGTAS